MAWLGKVTLGNFGDIAGAVTKISESVKNLEKNFDSALGFDERGKSQDEAQASNVERVSLLDPVFAFVGHKDVSKETSAPDVRDLTSSPAIHETLGPNNEANHQNPTAVSKQSSKELTEEEGNLPSITHEIFPESGTRTLFADEETVEQTQPLEIEPSSSQQQLEDSVEKPADHGMVERADCEDKTETPLQQIESNVEKATSPEIAETGDDANKTTTTVDDNKSKEKEEYADENHHEGETLDPPRDGDRGLSDPTPGNGTYNVAPAATLSDGILESIPNVESSIEQEETGMAVNIVVPAMTEVFQPGVEDNKSYINNLEAKVKALEESLEGAAHQSKVKADELSRLLIENDNYQFTLNDIKRSSDAELDTLKEEFQQRLNAAERKVYALTKERDMLRREQGRRDSSILLKEKDEIIKQVMAEGEELSKKQAAQEAQMRKLRAQIRELEEEKQRSKSKMQVEEATVESLRKDKAATEKALQEAVERTQVELTIQKEFYTNALNEAKEAEARAEVRADAEAKLELEHKVREAADREAALVQNLEELHQALSRTSEQAISREDMLQRDVEDLERRCQAAELRYEELVASVPESTRPLLRQIEAIRETMAVRAEAWSSVERTLNSRLQEAEAKAAASQERERAINERLTQTLSRMAVLEAQVSCLKAEQNQLTRSLEKERQRASENRQEYLAALEAAETHKGHAKQLDEDLKELRSRFKRELAEERTLRELLQQDVEREKQKAVKQEGKSENGNWSISSRPNVSQAQAPPEASPVKGLRRFSSVSDGSIEESFFLQASLDPTAEQVSPGTRRSSGAAGLPFLPGKGASVEQLEAFLSQRDGEIASYMSRLASLESTRNALAEELVKATTQCEKFRTEASSLLHLRSEMESLRRRHASALELMGERDEQVEELKADLADVKQMYREQIDMLVNQIERLSVSMGSQ